MAEVLEQQPQLVQKFIEGDDFHILASVSKDIEAAPRFGFSRRGAADDYAFDRIWLGALQTALVKQPITAQRGLLVENLCNRAAEFRMRSEHFVVAIST